ncbi:MAG TPA: DUF1015 domain-containing protein [Candidatus Limnocylindrales bacterium]|nr:DUF1015 domain-containing protein [Candidatus Limnocylindrales bacterium]
MPTVQPFRALRYAVDVVPDLGRVVAPPYDVIGPDRQRALLAQDPRNVVRLDLPPDEPGDEPDERYRRAARLLSAWRSDGTLRRDPRPSLYPYEQAYRLPGGREERTRRGIFASLGLEPFGPGAGVRPHERTLSGPKEDRYRLLRATGVNTSPVVGLYEDPSGAIPAWLDAVTSAASPVADLMDDEGVRHRLWRADPGDIPNQLGRSPITIADGHHRYETALRYRDERRRAASAELTADGWAPWDGILSLLLEPTAGHVDVLATHRVVRGLADDGLARLATGLPALFEARQPVSREELATTFAAAAGAPGGSGRFGLWTRDGGAILHARPGAFGSSRGTATRAVDALDVTILGAALERLLDIGRDEVDAGTRIAYTKDAAEAMEWVDAARDGADAAFLLDPTPAAAILAVAGDGDVMPQKSTYIYPKALTGLVINPLE